MEGLKLPEIVQYALSLNKAFGRQVYVCPLPNFWKICCSFPAALNASNDVLDFLLSLFWQMCLSHCLIHSTNNHLALWFLSCSRMWCQMTSQWLFLWSSNFSERDRHYIHKTLVYIDWSLRWVPHRKRMRYVFGKKIMSGVEEGGCWFTVAGSFWGRYIYTKISKMRR